jgi:hypothetical protein
MMLVLLMTYTADITDASQYIPQEPFTKVGHELETTQENLVIEKMINNMILVRRVVLKVMDVPDSFHSPQLP